MEVGVPTTLATTSTPTSLLPLPFEQMKKASPMEGGAPSVLATLAPTVLARLVREAPLARVVPTGRMILTIPMIIRRQVVRTVLVRVGRVVDRAVPTVLPLTRRAMVQVRAAIVRALPSLVRVLAVPMARILTVLVLRRNRRFIIRTSQWRRRRQRPPMVRRIAFQTLQSGIR